MTPDYQHLYTLSMRTLSELVTDEGIYASSAKGFEGRYHGFFGRDSLITAAFIHETEKATQEYRFLPMAINSILRLSEWQGREDNEETREQLGKIPHEIREHKKDYEHLTEDYIKAGQHPFYVDPLDNIMKNWDSNDATPLWIIIISRLIKDKRIIENDSIYTRLEKALQWCLRNIDEFGGLAGYSSQASAKFYELPHQAWKDQPNSYLHHDGRQPTLPIRDVAVNAWMWAALRYGAELFNKRNSLFAETLHDRAKHLKERFNGQRDGFLMQDAVSGYYFAEAIDGKGHQLHGVCADPAMTLWGYYEDEYVISNDYIPSIIKRIMQPDMFDEKAGLHTYSSEIQAFDPGGYHRGKYTFWPFISGLVSIGLLRSGYKTEAKKILDGMLNGISLFDSCIEMFIKHEGKTPMAFIDQKSKFHSSKDQAWTAGAVYFGSQYIMKPWIPKA